MLIVEDTPEEKGSASKPNVVNLVDPWLIQRLPREGRVKTEEILHDNIEEVFVEIIAYEPGYLTISFATMEEEERSEELKFADSIVTCSCRLHTFSASDSNSNMSLVDHGDVICAITDS